MIKLSTPSLALHSFDVPGYKYKLWQTRKLAKKTNVADVVNEILWTIGQTPEQQLDHVVINCHGSPGKLYIGMDNSETDITVNINNLGAFSSLKNKGLGMIWLVACRVASGADGENFCASLARAAGCYVVGADKKQFVNLGYYLQTCPDHCIDKFEGTAYLFDREGNKSVYKNN